MLVSDARSPWGQWILNKAIVMYDRQQKLKEMKAKEKKRLKELEGERVVRRAKAEQCHKEWVEKKVEKERQRRDKEARQKLQEVAENEKVLLVKSFLNVCISSKTMSFLERKGSLFKGRTVLC